MKIYTVIEIAECLRVEVKTVYRLIRRGLLITIPGIRHKRITESEFNRFLTCATRERY